MGIEYYFSSKILVFVHFYSTALLLISALGPTQSLNVLRLYQ